MSTRVHASVFLTDTTQIDVRTQPLDAYPVAVSLDDSSSTIFCTPGAAERLVHLLAEHVPNIVAVLTKATPGDVVDRDEDAPVGEVPPAPVPTVTATCVANRCDGARSTTTVEIDAWMDEHVAENWHDPRWPVTFRLDYAGSAITGVAYRDAAAGIASPADVILTSDGTSYVVGAAS